MTTRICQHCGKDFTPLRFANRAKFCSSDCRSLWNYARYQKPAKQRRMLRDLSTAALELERVA